MYNHRHHRKFFFLEKNVVFMKPRQWYTFVEFIYATCSWPFAGSAAFITSGRSGGDEYGVKSNSSKSPDSNLTKVDERKKKKQTMKMDKFFFTVSKTSISPHMFYFRPTLTMFANFVIFFSSFYNFTECGTNRNENRRCVVSQKIATVLSIVFKIKMPIEKKM